MTKCVVLRISFDHSLQLLPRLQESKGLQFSKVVSSCYKVSVAVKIQWAMIHFAVFHSIGSVPAQ